MENGRYKEGELLFKFKAGVLALVSLKAHPSVGATMLRRFSIVSNLEQVKLPEGLSVKNTIAQYMKNPSMQYAEPNYLKRTSLTPDDPLFGQQRGLFNTGQPVNGTIGFAGADIKATQGLDTITGNGVVSAVSLSLTAHFCLGSPFAGYEFCDGTSMVPPYVARLVGLLYSYYTGFTPSQIRGTILRYVDALQLPIVTKGRISAYLALSSLLTPTALTVASPTSSHVSLSWIDSATGEEGYKIERRTGGGLYSQIVTLAVGATTYGDSSLTDGTAFTYRVRAFNSFPNFTGTTPTGLTATAVSITQVTLASTNNSQTFQGVNVRRKCPGSDFAQIGSVGLNEAIFTDRGLTPQTTYTYHVAAFSSSAGHSAFSNAVTVTISSPSSSPAPSGSGGCSIGTKQNTPPTVIDFAVLLMPLLIVALWRRRG